MMMISSLIVINFSGLFRKSEITTGENFKLDFIKSVKVCDNLFAVASSSSSSSSGLKSYNMSTSYYSRHQAFLEAVETSLLSTGENLEGHSGLLKEQTMVLHYLSGHSFVRSICETGFNSGHSSFNYLTANPNASIYSFDLGAHNYSHLMHAYLNRSFHGRINMRFGNSEHTIPQFVEENPDVKCDVMLVDGGHNYDVAHADILNFSRMANLQRNVIVFDDFPTGGGGQLGKAWSHAVKKGIVTELMRCPFKVLPVDQVDRGFIIGKFIRSS